MDYGEDTEFVQSKKRELLELLKEQDVKCEIQGEYEYIVIKNPYCEDRGLEICFDDAGFLLLFGGWHGHYDYYEDDYDNLKESIVGILNGDCYALSAINDNKIHCSTLRLGDVSKYSSVEEIIKDDYNYFSVILEDALKLGYSIQVTTWNPVYTKSFDN